MELTVIGCSGYSKDQGFSICVVTCAALCRCLTLGVRHLWIQPGASSPELLARAREGGMSVHEGCVLLEL